jgi:N-acyl homoserine lactone hydrolase
MAAAAEPRPASPPLPGGRGGATVRLTPLLSGTWSAPPQTFDRPPGRLGALQALGIGVPRSSLVTAPIVSFLVEHPEAGPVLIDTGLHAACAVDPRQSLGRLGARHFRSLEMEPTDAVPAQLRARGIEPSDVRLVVMTHLHVDHASGMSEFPEATFVFSRREWEAANEPRQALRGYRRRQYDHAFDFRTLDFDAPEVDSFASFGRAIDLLGDGSIRLAYTPGHTHGHLSAVLRLADREALVCGDAVQTMKTITDGHRPSRIDDQHLFGRSLREIELYMEQTPDALVIPGHDMDAWRGLEPAYG